MKLVILEPLGVAKEQLFSMAASALGENIEITAYDKRVEDVPGLIERSKDADLVVLANLPYPRAVIENCPRLKMICVAFTGYDHVDIDCCRERGITVCNCAGYSTVAVAELVMGMIISLLRNVRQCDAAAHTGGTKDGLIGCELAGRKIGIIGTGAIGLRVAQLAMAFGCEVLGYSRTVKDIPGISYMSLEELLRQSDIVTLHVPATAETYHMLNADNIALMKRSAVLINCARGSVVDSQALADALNNGAIAGAGIDVLETEPPFDTAHPLVTAKNVILTPHAAFATEESMVKRARIVFENIAAYLAGKSVNVVC